MIELLYISIFIFIYALGCAILERLKIADKICDLLGWREIDN